VSTEGLTLDRFLGGRVVAAQPARGFRAGHDTVLLASAGPAESGSLVVEFGSGVGIASLCLAARVPDLRIVGIEVDPDLVRLANENAARNGVSDRVSFLAADVGAVVVDASIFTTSPSWGEPAPDLIGGRSRRTSKSEGGSGGGLALEDPLRPQSIDHVFFNPPFHPDSAHMSPVAARDRATRDSRDAVGDWTRHALSLVRERGTVTAIVRADRIDEILDAAQGHGGTVFPLLPRAGVPPKRAIVRIRKVNGVEFITAPGLVLHEADGRNTEAAEAVLRHARPLDLSP
jgi:tRNA1(Val) A37 N6-methylase TrmN6